MYKIGPLDLLEWIEATPFKLLSQPEILGKNWSVITVQKWSDKYFQKDVYQMNLLIASILRRSL